MNKKNLLIVGAGEAGFMIANEIVRNRKIKNKYAKIGFADDNESIEQVLIFDVWGPIDRLSSIIKEQEIDDIIIAIPSAEKELINKIINRAVSCDVNIKIVPGLSEIINGDVKYSQIRDFEPADLLGREEITFDIDLISSYYRDKTLFVTGAGGSIGSEIVLQLLNLPIKKLVVMGHGENSIHSLLGKVQGNERLTYVIGDVKDFRKVNYEIKRYAPNIIFHAAAHKHVPLMEEYPDESLYNNVIGTYNTARAAIENGVNRFIYVSTDKAVNPTSVMGASKRIGERLILSLGKHQGGTIFSLTRFGNVLGSRGSVIPVFMEQIRNGGPVTVTDENVTRYFMSIREAARLVIKSATLEEGRIFVLDMGRPVRIIDLARNMIKLCGTSEDEIKIEITGLREGEKLYEELLTESEHLRTTIYDKLFISDEEQIVLNEEELAEMIGRVESAIASYDKLTIKQLIKHYVPSYKGL